MASGFGSIRRFNSVFHDLYGRTPTDLRRLVRSRPESPRALLFPAAVSVRHSIGKRCSDFWKHERFPPLRLSLRNLHAEVFELNGSSRANSRSGTGNDAVHLRIDFPGCRTFCF